MQLAATLPSRLRQHGRAVVDGVLPPRCLACGATVELGRAVRVMLGGDHLFRAALLCALRSCLA
jgi:hypothetical protein